MTRAFACLFGVFLIVPPHPAGAQDSEAVGIRAQGMGGAFTAVADDSTASWWNPAGLVAGPFFNAILETSSRWQPADRDANPAWRGTSRGFSIAYPALALSYYRLRVSQIQPAGSTAGVAGSRQDTGAETVRLRSRILNQFGATVGQSIGMHLVLASTLKLVRAGEAVEVQSGASIDTAEELEPDSETHAGLDVGAMARLGRLTLGVNVRNATEPRFEEGVTAFKLARHVRAGVAFNSGGSGATITLGADVDVTRTDLGFGEERRFGVGTEVWFASRRLGVRAGLSGNALGPVRAGPSAGVSVGVARSTYVDAHVRTGSDESGRGWGSALRVTF
jgi:hypothetical protein